MEETIYILVINAGSTSTKVSIYQNEVAAINETINHPVSELQNCPDIWSQYGNRKVRILNFLKQKEIPLESLKIIACRCGTTKPVSGGIYRLTPSMLQDMRSRVNGHHAANVGSQIAFDLAAQLKIPAVTVDPPLTDEMINLAKYSGHPSIQRKSSFHALNQKATARKAAQKIGKPYNRLSLIIVHLGGGISIGTHRNGKVIDVNNALDGDGPFSPTRCGTLPTGALIDLCYSGRYTREEMIRMTSINGGLMAYLGTSDIPEIEQRIRSGDKKAEEVLNALSYQVVKEIGSAAAILEGNVDAIALTGNLVKCRKIIEFIMKKTSFIAPIQLYPGENEMEALALGALRYIKGEEQAQVY